MEIAPSALARLTSGKAVANTAIRWLPFFLPTLALAFNSSTSTLAAILGAAEACGIATLVAGRWLDAGKERAVMIGALFTVAASSMVALYGSVWTFLVAAMMIGLSSGFVTVSGHAWISARVQFHRRARFIGVFETSWASALLIGAPIMALLISAFGWRGPFVAIGVAALVVAALVWSIDDGEPRQLAAETDGPKLKITMDAWLVIGASAAISLAGLATIVVAGTWLDEVLGVSTGGIGLVAMSFGAAELFASMSSSAFADRLGKLRTMRVAVGTVLVGLLVISLAGTSRLVGGVGLLVFFVAFEYAIVTSFSLVSEAMPEARGRTLGISGAVGTVSRGLGVVAAGFLYDAYSIDGPAALSAVAACVTLVLLATANRRSSLSIR
ncbi:MAG: MFS transporter [Acidimicrobiales bacterium]